MEKLVTSLLLTLLSAHVFQTEVTLFMYRLVILKPSLTEVSLVTSLA